MGQPVFTFKLLSRIGLLLPSLLVFLYLTASAQSDSLPLNGQRRHYNLGAFVAPLTGPLKLNANFAEFRPGHFHSGVDLSTGGRTGLPVHAISQGYVSRIKVSAGGYGQALYITHPGGYVSVYGHLSAYAGKIGLWLRELQYKNHTYELDVKLGAQELPVSQGLVVAYTGDTGFSGGPHLHFEVRDEQSEEIINPLLAALHVPDHIPPRIKGITLFGFSRVLGIASIQALGWYPARQNAVGSFELINAIKGPLPAEVILGISADDLQDNKGKYRGIYGIRLRENGSLIYESFFEQFAFDQTRAINSYLDFPLAESKNIYVQRSYREPGNQVSLYGRVLNHGIIQTQAGLPLAFSYEVKDAAGNTSRLNFTLKKDLPSTLATANSSLIPEPQPASQLIDYSKQVTVGFQRNGQAIDPITAPIGLMFPALSIFDNQNIGARFASGLWHIGSPLLAIRDSVLASFELPPGMTLAKAIVYLNGTKPLRTFQQGGRVQAWIKEFGQYGVKEDLKPPNLILFTAPSHKTATKQIRIYVHDPGSGIQHYEGRIDGTWIMLRYDQKNDLLWYPFDLALARGKHLLQVHAIDRAGNESLLEKEFSY